jgi:hypothetical protein
MQDWKITVSAKSQTCQMFVRNIGNAHTRPSTATPISSHFHVLHFSQPCEKSHKIFVVADCCSGHHNAHMQTTNTKTDLIYRLRHSSLPKTLQT